MGQSIADLLGDKLPESLKNRKHSIEVGNVYVTTMGASEGLKVKHKRDKKKKYFVVLGFDSAGSVYGGVLVSSDPPNNIPRSILLYQLLIKSKNNFFLDYDSFINCTKIFCANPDKLTANNFKGCLFEDDLYDVIRAVLDIENVSITPKERKKYNIQLPEDI